MRGRAVTVLGAVVSIVAVAGVVAWALDQEPPEFPTSGPRLAALGASLALYLLTFTLRGERWHELLRFNGAHPDRRDSWALMAVAYMGNNVLPARAGDAIRTFFVVPRARTDARTVIGTLLAERLLDLAVLGTAFVVLAFAAADGAGIPSGDALVPVLAGLAAAAVAALLLALVLHRRGLLARLWGALAPMVAATRSLGGRHGAEMLAVTVAIWALEAAVWWTAAEAAGLGLSVVEACYVLALSSMFALIPSGPGYAGTMDAAVLFAARVLDRSASLALSYLLLLRFVLFVPITALGLVLLVTRYGGWGRLRAARAARVSPEQI